MKVGLFIPCYIDAFFPEVGVATLELLERLQRRCQFVKHGFQECPSCYPHL
jgi:L-lactate dehydrogenase complex protein LldE